MTQQVNVTVLGAGVVGLTTALVLSRTGKYNITIIAKHMPGDYDIEYASPWAGANYEPYGAPGSLLQKLETDTGPELFKLCRETKEAGITFQPCYVYNRKVDSESPTGKWVAETVKPNPWFKDLVEDFRVMDKNELPPFVDSGTTFTTVCINTAIYLPWLLGQCLKNGVIVKRGIVKHISEAAHLHHSGTKADAIINATGIFALKLGGVEDTLVYPGRGQTVLVRQSPNIMSTISGTDDGPDELVYTMTRAAGGGTILGGCFQANNWESQPDLNLANRIMKRCVALVPELADNKGGFEHLDIIRHGVGLRPMREGGPRVETDKIDGVWVVHNYGHGGYGYQSSWGTAKEAARLLELAMREKARL